MDVILTSPYLLLALFFLIACAYSSIGLAGGSSYTALMFIVGMNTLTIPFVSLILNLFVSTIGSFNYIRYKHARLNLLLPFVITSIPMAYFGGSLHLAKNIFYIIMFISLLFIAIRIYFLRETKLNLNLSKTGRVIVSLISGSILGFVAGAIGIGGGIYLVPLIIIFDLGTQKQAAAAGIIFVWLNSLSGLISRLQHNTIDLIPYLPLIIAVILGGTLGSQMGATRFTPKTMGKILGIIVLIAILVLSKKIIDFYF